MADFVATETGWVNAEYIEGVSADSRSVSIRGGGTATLRRDAYNTIVRRLPAAPGTAALVVDDPRQGRYHYEPVIAWAVFLSGEIFPITPMHPHGDWDREPAIEVEGVKGVCTRDMSFSGALNYLDHLKAAG